MFQRSMRLKGAFSLKFQHVKAVIAPCGGLQPHVLTKDRRNADGAKPWPMCLRQMREKSSKAADAGG